MRSTVLHVLATTLLALSSVACGGTQLVVPRLAPAEVNLSGYERLAIGGVAGQGGDVVVDNITSALVATQRFQVLDRKHLSELVKEQDFAISGRVSDDSAVSIGQMIGSAALLIGDVARSDYRETVARNPKKCMKEGKEYDCVEVIRTAIAELQVGLKVLDTETGKILSAKVIDASRRRATQATDEEPAIIEAKDAMLAECSKQVAEDFVKVIAPHQIQVAVALLDDGDLPELEMGNNFARIGNWQEAMASYSTALGKAKDNADIEPETRAKAHYNLGVALGYSGRYDDGVAEIERAFALDPQDLFAGQIATLKRFKEDDAKLAEQNAKPAQE